MGGGGSRMIVNGGTHMIQGVDGVRGEVGVHEGPYPHPVLYGVHCGSSICGGRGDRVSQLC